MHRRVALRPLSIVGGACGAVILAGLLAGCELLPFGPRREPQPQPQPTAPARPTPPRLPSPTILIPPPID